MITELEHFQASGETYPGLAGLSYARRWLDGFLSIVEGYLMTFSTVLITVGISFSMFDFLTGGTALDNPTVYGWWAIIQTVAIDAQFINMWYRAKCAIHNRHYWQASGYVLLGAILAFVTFGASLIPAIQKGLGISFNAAINQTGINPLFLIMARSLVAILLGIIGAFQRAVIVYERPAPEAQKHTNWLAKLRAKLPKKQTKMIPQIAPKPEAILPANCPQIADELSEKEAQNMEDIAAQIEENTLELAEKIATFFAPESPANDAQIEDTTPPQIAPKITRKLPEEPPEMPRHIETASTQLKQPGGHIRYTPQEAAALPICREKGVKSSHIKTAIQRGDLRANLNGKVSKSALEKWLRQHMNAA